MNRRKFIAASTKSALLATGLNLYRPNTSKAIEKTYRLQLVTTWPPKMPVLQESAEYFKNIVETATGGKVKIKVYAGGELIPPLGVFDAVSLGSVDMGIGAPYYWAGKSQAFQFFSAIPFGFNASEFYSWLENGGGQELWNELYAPFNLTPMPIGNTGPQMGGWFRKEINTIDDFKGLKIRMPGLGGKILSEVGANVVLMAGSEIYTALERGTIDATEWISPYHDERLGLHKTAKYYYSPGWHEPSGNLELIVNTNKWNLLPKEFQTIIQAAAAQTTQWTINKSIALNGPALERILSDKSIEVRKFSPEILSILKSNSDKILSELASIDPQAKKVLDSYSKFANSISKWTKL